MGTADVRDLQKGSAEMIVLALLEGRARHGYELAKLIESESGNKLQFHVASLYPMLYRLERKRLVEGRWVEKAGERRRRFYRLTPEGRRDFELMAKEHEQWILEMFSGFSMKTVRQMHLDLGKLRVSLLRAQE